MKKNLLPVIFGILFSIASFAQTDKGWREVGGAGSLRLDFKNTNYSFSLAPETYWFVANSFALGTDFGFGFSAGTTKMDSTTTKTSALFAYVTPGFRFFFLDPSEHHWRPYFFLNAGVDMSAGHVKVNGTSTNSKSSGFAGYAGFGEAWFFSDHAAFDMRLHLIDFTYSNAAFSPTITIGVQAFFHHE